MQCIRLLNGYVIYKNVICKYEILVTIIFKGKMKDQLKLKKYIFKIAVLQFFKSINFYNSM